MPILPGPDTPTGGSGQVVPWATVADVCAPCNEYGFDETVLEDSLQAASEILFNMTGRRWPGEQSDVIRPCRGSGLIPRTLDGGDMWCACNQPRSCGCSPLSEIRLPGSPVTSIDYVKIDGQIVDPARYRLDDHRWLVWLPDEDGDDDRRGWPCCQRMDRADSEDDTFTVAYTYGEGPDQGGVMAAAALGCQLALAFCGAPADAAKCRLPKRVTSIARQGVTIAVLDPLTLFKEGQTGLPEVDMWIASKMLGPKNRRATVLRIGQGRSARRTGQ